MALTIGSRHDRDPSDQAACTHGGKRLTFRNPARRQESCHFLLGRIPRAAFVRE